MKITRKQLKTIIENSLNELNPADDRVTGGDPYSQGTALQKTVPVKFPSNHPISKAMDAVDETITPEIALFLGAFIDPSGVLSIPEIAPANQTYEKNPTVFNAVMLILAVAAAIPFAGKLAKLGSKGLKTIRASLNLAKKKAPEIADVADKGIKAIENAQKTAKVATQTRRVTRSYGYLNPSMTDRFEMSYVLDNARDNAPRLGLDYMYKFAGREAVEVKTAIQRLAYGDMKGKTIGDFGQNLANFLHDTVKNKV